MKKLFTERHGLTEPRVKEELDVELTKGLLTVVKAKIGENLFGEHFPELCPDSPNPTIGTDHQKLKDGLAAYSVIYPDDWPKYENGDYHYPADPQLFDLVEFLYEHAGEPHGYSWHTFFGHDHLSFDKDKGREKFETDINRFFERNGLLKSGIDLRHSPRVFLGCEFRRLSQAHRYTLAPACALFNALSQQGEGGRNPGLRIARLAVDGGVTTGFTEDWQIARDHRGAGGHRLRDWQAKTLAIRWKQHNRRSTIKCRQRSLIQMREHVHRIRDFQTLQQPSL